MKFTIDTGAEITAVRIEELTANQQQAINTTERITATMPNGTTITAIGTIPISISPHVHTTAHVFKKGELAKSLLAAADITNNGCKIILENDGVTIHDATGKIILQQPKLPSKLSWTTRPISNTKSEHKGQCQINNLIRHSINADRVAYTSACFGNPPDSTLGRALNKNYFKHNGINTNMVHMNPTNSLATAYGRLHQTRKNLQSTKCKAPTIKPTVEAIGSTHKEPSNFSSSDIAGGKLPVRSKKGNLYTLIITYHGYIRKEHLRNLESESIKKGHEDGLKFFTSKGHIPIFHRMDNQTSSQVHSFIVDSMGIPVQYVPPNNHRSLPAERAIQTWKEHCISSLSNVDPNFPLFLWDELDEQAEITLNHLLPYAPNPSISAYEGIHGKPYDFKAHPIHPPGMKVIAHTPAKSQEAWGIHGLLGYYLGPAPNHYRSFRVYIDKTKSIRITDTIQCFPTKLRVPGSNPADIIYNQLLKINQTLDMNKIRNADQIRPAIDNIKSIIESCTGPLNERVLQIPSPTQEATPTTQIQRVSNLPNHPLGSKRAERHHARNQIQTYASYPIKVLKPDKRKQLNKYIGKSFLDKENNTTYQIVEIVKQVSDKKAIPKPFFKYYDPHLHNHGPPPAEMDNEYQPISELLSWNSKSSSFTNKSWAQWRVAEINSISDSIEGQKQINIDAAGKTLTYKMAIKGENKDLWAQADDQEIIRLMTSKTITPMNRKDQPIDRIKDTTYYSPQVKEKHKANTIDRRVRGTLGGDRINYNGPTMSHVADPIAILIHQISVISDRRNKGTNTRYITADASDFYLGSKLKRPEWMWIPISHMSEQTIEKHDLRQYVHNKKILFQVNGTIYGHPASGHIAQNDLIEHLKKYDYTSTREVPCLFTHPTSGISFTLVVDDFGIKYTNDDNLKQFLSILQQPISKWKIKVDRTGGKYNGIRLNWNYNENTLIQDIPNYVTDNIARLNLQIKNRRTPAKYIPPQYGKVEMAPEETETPCTPEESKLIERVHGIFLYYSRKVDPIIKRALLDISLDLKSPTKTTLQAAYHLLGYMQRYPHAQTKYTACDMILRAQSDASHHGLPGSRSVAAGVHYLGEINEPNNYINGFIQVICKKIEESVCTSAAESEYAALYINGQALCLPQQVLRVLNYPQHGPTTITTDNTIAQGIAHDTLTNRKSKAFLTRYHWIRDRINEHGQFKVKWQSGKTLDADCPTKHHPANKHEAFMKRFYHLPKINMKCGK